MRFLALASVLFLSTSLFANTSFAKTTSLVGSWGGGGKIYPKSASPERVRCRVSVHRSGRGYSASSTCHSAIGSASPSAYLTRRGNTYSGKFKDSKNGTSGWITFTLKGRRLYVSLSSSNGSARLSLRKR